MKYILTMLAAIFILPTLLPTDADAKRRGGFSSRSSKKVRVIPIIIPMSRGSSDVVFVRELPDIENFKREGRYFDLGWKHGFFGGGEWVGYFSKPTRGYVEVNQKVVVEKLLPALGMTAVDAPAKASSFDGVSMGSAWSGIKDIWPFGFVMTFVMGFVALAMASNAHKKWQQNRAIDKELAKHGISRAQYDAHRAAAQEPQAASAGFGNRKNFGRASA
ncbi:hypothetical protein [Ahrensia sp. R2A130]|uniref:hypothetical protein n=1 Tax=Ahrensia sp. R2A130 TaxID=744979 RepID=UPI0001E0B44C|nr:hypothetical protein [Ahrensia sp. R2A130]EFL90121.1 immunoglobulin heavy chain -JH3 region [Ahrensia sp. R2A130]